MIKKENLYKVLYIISIILIVVFLIVLLFDYINYNPYETSFPLYSIAIVRIVEFVIPSIIIGILGSIIKKKIKK